MIIYMDVTINHMMQLGKEKELNIVLKDSVLKTFEKIVDGNLSRSFFIKHLRKRHNDSNAKWI